MVVVCSRQYAVRWHPRNRGSSCPFADEERWPEFLEQTAPFGNCVGWSVRVLPLSCRCSALHIPSFLFSSWPPGSENQVTTQVALHLEDTVAQCKGVRLRGLDGLWMGRIISPHTIEEKKIGLP